MKPAALLYISAIDHLREIAKENGYALAVHGSLARDLDLVACPWVDSAVDATALAEALRAKLELCTGEKWYAHANDPGVKPHGRLAWNFVPGCGGGMFVDLSVMPHIAPDFHAPLNLPADRSHMIAKAIAADDLATGGME